MLRLFRCVIASSHTQSNLKLAQSFCSACPAAVRLNMEPSLYQAPAEVRGMTTLDREMFTQTITVPALRVPTWVINKVVKSLKKSVIQRSGVHVVVQDKEQSSDFRLVLLDPHRISSPQSFSEDEALALKAYDVAAKLQEHELRLTYDNLKPNEVLEAVLPEGQVVTHAFSRIGHIAHMNLRENQLPYKNLIGQVILDKNPGVTCVVNKTDFIEATYRNFKMELLAGEENMVAKVKENGAVYEFDFSLVYWNPRLCREHERLVQLFKRGDTVFDVFAGVGPFAVPAAMSGANVLANDLNPESYKWLQHNCKANKMQSRVRTFNLDGRAFIQGPLKQELPALLKGTARVHVVMNLPALALDFLDAFRGLLHQEAPCDGNLPTVHCHGFSKEDDPTKDVVERASRSLGVPLEGRCSVHHVRQVAPNKSMMCVSFTLPKEVLYSSERHEQTVPSEEPAPKRQKCDKTTDLTEVIL